MWLNLALWSTSASFSKQFLSLQGSLKWWKGCGIPLMPSLVRLHNSDGAKLHLCFISALSLSVSLSVVHVRNKADVLFCCTSDHYKVPAPETLSKTARQTSPYSRRQRDNKSSLLCLALMLLPWKQVVISFILFRPAIGGSNKIYSIKSENRTYWKLWSYRLRPDSNQSNRLRSYGRTDSHSVKLHRLKWSRRTHMGFVKSQKSL